MATGMQGETIWSANANSSSVGIFLFAKAVTSGGADLFDLAGAGDNVAGIFIEVNGAGNPCSVQLDRVGKITLNASLNAGALVQPDASGKAVAHTSSQPAGILLGSGVAGNIVPIKLF